MLSTADSDTASGHVFSGVSPTPIWGCVLSGKVHGTQGVLVDLNGLGQGLLVTPVALA